MFKLYNSLSRRKEEFVPLHPPVVTMYTCGQTVYDYTHIGQGRKYVNDDLLRRALSYFGYQVKHVQNVTDVGHLTSDADHGEDKLEKGARRTGKTVWEVAEFFTNYFYESMDKLNVLRPNVICRATEHIEDQIKLVSQLMDRGYAYDTPEAVYFDVSKFGGYGELFQQNLAEKRVAVRDSVETGRYKRNPVDFVLWFKKVGRYKDHIMSWDSPWGEGFPGWHIECSAMSMKYLGETIDIHTGGEDHLSVHHPNEIAQSEAATGVKFVRYWVHHAFLTVDGKKMSKSLQNFYRIEDVEAKGFSALDLRYFYLTAHYRKPQNFTWEALKNAQNSRRRLNNYIVEIVDTADGLGEVRNKNGEVEAYRLGFREAIQDDLNAPQAVAVLWEVVKSRIPAYQKRELVTEFDKVLGLNLFGDTHSSPIPSEVSELARQRELARQSGEFKKADVLREKILQLGYQIEDRPEGFRLFKVAGDK